MKRVVYYLLFLLVALSACQLRGGASSTITPDAEGIVYKDDNIEFRQIDANTWHGKGNLMYSESVYLVAGEDDALLIDAGMYVPGLKAIAEKIVGKKNTLVITHVHSDHTGIAVNEWESLWMNAADEVNVEACMPNYQGKKQYLHDGQIFDLGGRQIEVLFAPGHTPGSTLLIDKEAHYGFSSDAFGSSNLLVFTDLSTVSSSCSRTLRFVEKYGLTHFYPGHFGGENIETPKRIDDIRALCDSVLAGTKEYQSEINVLNHLVKGEGITIRFNAPQIR